MAPRNKSVDIGKQVILMMLPTDFHIFEWWAEPLLTSGLLYLQHIHIIPHMKRGFKPTSHQYMGKYHDEQTKNIWCDHYSQKHY